MADLIKTSKQEIKLPEVREVSLLTVEEYDKYYDLIDYPMMTDVPYFYLLDEAENHMVYVAVPQDDISTSEPDFEDFGPEDYDDDEPQYGTGNRPVIRFEGPIPGAEPGDKIKIAEKSFTVLSPDTILLDSYISKKCFDENTNVYEKSAIKGRVDKWFRMIKKMSEM